MQLYITPGSPYARAARIMVLEKGLTDQVETIVARTREADSPYYAINPSGRVPYLVRDDGVGMEESAVICRYLDHLDGRPAFDPPAGEAGWEALRLGAIATSLVDGVAVLTREMRRPETQRSPGIVRHETDRARRLIDHWETEIDHHWMNGPLSMAQIMLMCGLGIVTRDNGDAWQAVHPKLGAWFRRILARPSLAQTVPPPLKPA